MIKILEMRSQNYRNGVQEWDEKLEQCPYYPSHQIRPTRFGHHLLQCRKALSKQPTSPYYHKIDDLVVSIRIWIGNICFPFWTSPSNYDRIFLIRNKSPLDWLAS